MKEGPIRQEVHEIADNEDFSPEKPDNQLGDTDLYPPTPARPCEEKSTTNAGKVSDKPELKKEGEGKKSRSKQSPLKLAACASRRMMEKKKNGDKVAKNLAEDFERMAEKRDEKKPKRAKKPLDTTDLATCQNHPHNFCKLKLIYSAQFGTHSKSNHESPT